MSWWGYLLAGIGVLSTAWTIYYFVTVYRGINTMTKEA